METMELWDLDIQLQASRSFPEVGVEFSLTSSVHYKGTKISPPDSTVVFTWSREFKATWSSESRNLGSNENLGFCRIQDFTTQVQQPPPKFWTVVGSSRTYVPSNEDVGRRLRPFGCGVILGGYDRDGPQLYMVEPSGVSHRYFGTSIGKGRQAAKTEIEKLKLSEMTCRQGVIEVAKIIYGVHDEAKDKELEMSWVCDESNHQHQKVPDDLLEAAKAAAKAALEEMDAD